MKHRKKKTEKPEDSREKPQSSSALMRGRVYDCPAGQEAIAQRARHTDNRKTSPTFCKTCSRQTCQTCRQTRQTCRQTCSSQTCRQTCSRQTRRAGGRCTMCVHRQSGIATSATTFVGRHPPTRSKPPDSPDQHKPKAQDQISNSVSYGYQIP